MPNEVIFNANPPYLEFACHRYISREARWMGHGLLGSGPKKTKKRLRLKEKLRDLICRD